MSKISTAVIIFLSLTTATAAWMIYVIEHQRHDREMREAQASERAALDAEMYPF